MKVAIATASILLAIASVALVGALGEPANGSGICVKELKTGRKFPVHVPLNQTVLHAKRIIRNRLSTNVPPKYQELKFNGQSLEDDQTLEHYNIGRHSELAVMDHTNGFYNNWDDIGSQMPAKMGGRNIIRINLYMAGSIRFGVDLPATDTIGMLKEKIFQQEEYPVEGQKLFYVSNHELDDSRTLESYKFRDFESLRLEATLDWCSNEVSQDDN